MWPTGHVRWPERPAAASWDVENVTHDDGFVVGVEEELRQYHLARAHPI